MQEGSHIQRDWALPDQTELKAEGPPSKDAPAALSRALDGIDRLLGIVCGCALVASALSIALITLLVCLEVFLRVTGLGSTLISTEMSGYLLVAIVFLGLAWTFRGGGFIRVELFYSALPPRLSAAADILVLTVGTVVVAVYSYYLCLFVLHSFNTGVSSIYISRTPLWIPQLAMPIGSCLLTAALLLATVRAAIVFVQGADAGTAIPKNRREEVDSTL